MSGELMIEALTNDIQSAIVEERNNHGDHSVNGDDLRLASLMTAWALGHKIGTHHEEVIKESMPGFYSGTLELRALRIAHPPQETDSPSK